jgi:glycerol dehydrogenase
MSVIYKEDGSLENYLFYGKNPDLVMVDSQVVANAPSRFLAAGFGDALSTWIEARAIKKAEQSTILQANQTLTSLAIAEKCEEIIFNYSRQAIQANEAKVVTPALEYVIEANILMSGLGFESGGTCAVHPIQNAFLVLGRGKNLMHGERVAFGILCQLMMEGVETEEFDRYLELLLELNLPTTLADQGLEDITADELRAVGETATAPWESIHKLPAEVSAESVIDAILAVDRYVKAYKEKH